jgi:hypothetical protein
MPKERFVPEHWKHIDPRRGVEPHGGVRPEPTRPEPHPWPTVRPAITEISIPRPVVGSSALPPEAVKFREEMFPPGKDPTTGKDLLSHEAFWEAKQSIYAPVEEMRDFSFGRAVGRAKAFGSNLMDHWYDALSQSRYSIAQKEARTEDPEARQQYKEEREVFEKAFGFSDSILSFAGRDNLSQALERWNKLRRNFPHDWTELRASQFQVFELTKSLFEKCEPIRKDNKYSVNNPIDAALAGVQRRLTTIGLEVAVQGSELLNRRKILLASPSEAMANDLEASTSVMKYRGELAERLYLYETPIGDFLELKAKGTLPSERINPLKDSLAKLQAHIDGATIDYTALSDETRTLANELTSVTDKNSRLATGPDRERALELLAAVTDEVLSRLDDPWVSSVNADLEESAELNLARNALEKARPRLKAEAWIESIGVGGDPPSKWWSGQFNGALDEKQFTGNAEALKGIKELKAKFNEDFGNQLNTFFKEIGRATPDKQALREAVYRVKDTLRRYVDHVGDPLAKGALAQPRNDLLTTLNALQLAVAQKLRDAVAINGSLD